MSTQQPGNENADLSPELDSDVDVLLDLFHTFLEDGRIDQLPELSDATNPNTSQESSEAEAEAQE